MHNPPIAPLRLADARKTKDFTFIDLFAGIGGTRLAFDAAGGECVYTSEWNPHAQKTYIANFGDHEVHGDITTIDASSIPDHDILIGGFPCQPFSIAGVSKKTSLGRDHGFLDKAQGTLFFDIARIIAVKRPRAFFLENVKNITTHDKGQTFKVIREVLTSLGYSFHHQVVDAKYYVPQHRERAFMVGFDTAGGRYAPEFRFPEYPTTLENLPKLKGILEKKVDARYTLTDGLWAYLQNYANKHAAAGNGFGFGLASPNGHSRTLSARYYKDGSEILIAQRGRNPRRLTPRECARLQGFPDDFLIVSSDTQAYKQFGNSVAVPAIRAAAEAMRPYIKAMQAYERLFPRAHWLDPSELTTTLKPPAPGILD